MLPARSATPSFLAFLPTFRDAKHDFGFPLLSDPDHATADSYGTWGPKKLYGKEYEGIIRSAFLIGANGKVEHAWYKISPKATPEKLLAALEDA
jgi:peroxiredoxin Q/BCP